MYDETHVMSCSYYAWACQFQTVNLNDLIFLTRPTSISLIIIINELNIWKSV